MAAVDLYDPLIHLCLLYAGALFIAFCCAPPRNFPPSQDRSPTGPSAQGGKWDSDL
jgi:hypothetical protein